MSQKCPRCGLFNPASAERCDCGYDFATQQVERSYLDAHLVEKHGTTSIVRTSSRRSIVNGVLLLAVAGSMSIATFVATGRVGVATLPLIAGTLLLVSGIAERRREKPDASTLRELRRRS